MRQTVFKLLFTIIFAAFAVIGINAQNSEQTRAFLDKTAKTIGKPGGISASFTMNHPSTGNVSGTISVKGNKFNARTPQAIVWFNGKTQWTYMKRNNEVNISNPTAAQQQMMNPYTFINIYKSGYKLSMKATGSNNEVHLVANNAKQSIQEMYITVNRKTYVPSSIRMRHGGKWYNITVSNFSTKNQPNRLFSFNSKDYPSAEVIDLR